MKEIVQRDFVGGYEVTVREHTNLLRPARLFIEKKKGSKVGKFKFDQLEVKSHPRHTWEDSN